MNLISQKMRTAALIVTTVAYSGCTFVFPLLSSVGRTEDVGPYGSIEEGSRVTVSMKSGTVKHGIYTGFVERRQPDYKDRYASAVRADSVLWGMPVPGDTVRVATSTAPGTFRTGVLVGLGDSRRTGIWLDPGGGSSLFLQEWLIEAVERGDGSPVDYRRLQAAVVSGQLPSMRDRTVRTLWVSNNGESSAIDAREIDHIVVSIRRHANRALLAGMIMDLVVVGVAVLSLSSDDLFSGSF